MPTVHRWSGAPVQAAITTAPTPVVLAPSAQRAPSPTICPVGTASAQPRGLSRQTPVSCPATLPVSVSVTSRLVPVHRSWAPAVQSVRPISSSGTLMSRVAAERLSTATARSPFASGRTRISKVALEETTEP